MRILVVGAGAVGGYFGGRLLDAGHDATFLVRARRATELAASGLVIKSPLGDIIVETLTTVLAENLTETFDLVLLSCKSYDLDNAIASFAPAVGPRTAILPLLNGMAHFDVLDEKFGRARVLGGICGISVMLNERREVVHLQSNHWLKFGERIGGLSDRVNLLADAMAHANFEAVASENIMLETWEKWVTLATLAATTSLMRASIGAILKAPGGRDFILGVLNECIAVAEASGHAPRAAAIENAHAVLTRNDSSLTASLMRDVEAGSPVEADQIIGDLIKRGEARMVDTPKLRTAYTYLKTYESQRI